MKMKSKQPKKKKNNPTNQGDKKLKRENNQ